MKIQEVYNEELEDALDFLDGLKNPEAQNVLKVIRKLQANNSKKEEILNIYRRQSLAYEDIMYKMLEPARLTEREKAIIETAEMVKYTQLGKNKYESK